MRVLMTAYDGDDNHNKKFNERKRRYGVFSKVESICYRIYYVYVYVLGRIYTFHDVC
jgi:hypothetical protein